MKCFRINWRTALLRQLDSGSCSNILSLSLNAFMIGRILERKWLLDNYVQAVISAIKLPDQINFIQISAMPYEGRGLSILSGISKSLPKLTILPRSAYLSTSGCIAYCRGLPR